MVKKVRKARRKIGHTLRGIKGPHECPDLK